VSQRRLPILPMLGEVAATASIVFALGLAVFWGAIFGVFTIFVVNPIYHWITGQWVDSVVFQLAASFWATVVCLDLLGAIIKEKFGEGESRFVPYLIAVVGEFSSAFKLVGFFSTLVALGGPFVKLAAFLEVFKNGVTLSDAFVGALFWGGVFSFLELCKLAYQRRRMGDQPKDMAYYLGEAEKYREKAKAASEPGLTAAFETVAREYVAKAHALDPPNHASQE
jgi:hypothetical protein